MTTLVTSDFAADGGVDTITLSIDCTGGDYLRCWVYAENEVTVTDIDRGAQTPTLISSSSAGSWLGCYELVAPATGAADVVVQLSGVSGRVFLYCSVWSGVDGDTPSRTPATATPEGVTEFPITTPSEAGDVIEAVCMCTGAVCTLDTSAGAVQIESSLDWLEAGRSFGSAYDVTEDAEISWAPAEPQDGFLVGIPIVSAGGATGPTIDSVDTDDTITSTQETWDIDGSNFDNATVTITQGAVTVEQEINAQNATTINCDTVFDAGPGPHLKYGEGSLEATNADLESDSILIQIDAPSGRSYVDIGTPNPTADNRITAVPDIESGDQLEVSGVVGGTIADVNVYSDATFDCAVAVTAFSVRCWDADDETWGAPGVQNVTGDEDDPPTFEGTIPTQNFTQNVDIGTINFSTYFASVESYALNQALPDGLSFNTSTAALTGTPTESGTFGGFVITATNSFGTADSNEFTISIASDQEFISGGRARDGRTRGFMSYMWGRG